MSNVKCTRWSGAKDIMCIEPDPNPVNVDKIEVFSEIWLKNSRCTLKRKKIPRWLRKDIGRKIERVIECKQTRSRRADEWGCIPISDKKDIFCGSMKRRIRLRGDSLSTDIPINEIESKI